MAKIIRFSRRRRVWASGARRSTASRVIRVGFLELVIASERAMAVAEFFERSPRTRLKSAESKAWVRMGDLANEPLGVLG